MPVERLSTINKFSVNEDCLIEVVSFLGLVTHIEQPQPCIAGFTVTKAAGVEKMVEPWEKDVRVDVLYVD